MKEPFLSEEKKASPKKETPPTEPIRGDCDLAARCENAGRDCEHCTRSWDYEEAYDHFQEKWE